MNRKASFDAIATNILGLSDEQQLAILERPERFKELMAMFAQEVASSIYVVHIDDKDVPERYQIAVALWRNYAANRGYTGPVAWKVREGFTLKNHAPLAGPCYGKLGYLQDWELRNDEPTKDSIVFWVPRLADGSTSKTIPQMEKLRGELKQRYELPDHHANSFGSIALLFALILVHFKRTGERVPLKYLYAASDTFRVDGNRLIAGCFYVDGLFCLRWYENADGDVGFFLLGVEELGQ